LKTILLISHSSAGVGGGEDDFLKLLKFLNKKFIIYSIFPNGDRASEFARLSDEFLIIPNSVFPIYKFNLKQYIVFIYYSFKKLFVLYPYLKNLKNIDLCYVNSSVCFLEMYLLKHFNIPFVVSVKEKINPALIRNSIYKLFGKSARKVIVVADYLKVLVSKYVEKSKITVIRPSIDEDYLTVLKNDIRVEHENNKFVILNIGQIYELKNQILLIDAIHKVKNKENILIKLFGYIVDHNYYKKMLQKISKNNLSNIVKYYGPLNKQNIVKEYLISDIVIITSIEEGMPLVLIESLFFEKPLITTNAGGIPEIIINKKNGLIINSNDPDSLAKAISELKNDKIIYNSIKSNTFITYKNNFNYHEILNKHYEIFKECLL
jgi:glycosyltransferase involved in cell wall biosynthesis